MDVQTDGLFKARNTATETQLNDLQTSVTQVNAGGAFVPEFEQLGFLVPG